MVPRGSTLASARTRKDAAVTAGAGPTGHEGTGVGVRSGAGNPTLLLTWLGNRGVDPRGERVKSSKRTAR